MTAAGAPRLLVVDDNTANLQFLVKVLGDAGYQTFPASDGELALEFIRETPPDLVLLDVKMPGVDGEEVCRRLKAEERTRTLPVIFISALESEADRVRCFAAGGVDYVTKPFRPEEVLARVQTHLVLRRVQLDLERRNAELADARAALEERVRERTAELAAANATLVAEVAERKRAEEAASESRRFLDAIIEALADPVFVADRQGRLVRVNGAMCRLAGRTREELLGRPGPPLPGDAGRAFEARNAAVIARGREDGEEERLPDAAGGARVLLVRRTLCHDDRGEPFLVGVMRDVTDYERMQEQVLQAEKMETIGLLAGGVAHDFNNLLAPILGGAETLLAEMGPGHPWHELVNDVHEAARSGHGLTQRLLAFSRRQRFELRDVDVADVVRRFEPMIRRTLREDVELRLDLPPRLAPAHADPAQLQQVLANLCSNANDAMPGGGKLTVAAKEVELDDVYAAHHREVHPGRYVALSVTDTGTGMAPEVKAHLFEPFFTTKEQGKGTGLGLSTVFGIVKQHGGSISVYTEPGRGTTVQVYLPVAQGAATTAAAPSAPVPQATAAGSETILVVEDDERVRRTTVRALTALGYRVLEAPDAGRCLELMRSHDGRIALLLSDVIMPGMHGRELYEALRRSRPDLKVLFMSGYPSLVVGGEDDVGPGFPFIQKPFARKELADKIRAAIDGPPAITPG